jgi:hypothetical protein
MGATKQLVGVASRESGDSGKHAADGPVNAQELCVASPIGAAGIGEAHDQQPSVVLSVSADDRRILTALIDRTAPQRRIIDDLRLVLPQFAVPYRELDPRIVEAIQVKLRENMTFEEASICVFGTPDYARVIRYWRNRWELQWEC